MCAWGGFVPKYLWLKVSKTLNANLFNFVSAVLKFVVMLCHGQDSMAPRIYCGVF